jgi:hypothetical protein
MLLVGTFTLATTPGFAARPAFEKIRATYSQAGNTVGVTLTAQVVSQATISISMRLGRRAGSVWLE